MQGFTSACVAASTVQLLIYGGFERFVFVRRLLPMAGAIAA